ncbi:hypothetical protein O7599_30590 [Streptomyces sp. WMMC500]|uniref:hypothetical protein n=1 Tax=Streptomyces sp. WMMC500 TaxID=3015154 RepID=UPI00248D0FF5|nr:hypothetical protein [Streptomyces sp. WMMC500]WBB59855.1 hypothetical protein O7599_30590 [Streptomyces sp. WMMC500]
MAGVRTVVLVLCAGLVAALLAGCGEDDESRDATRDATRAVAELLRQRSAAVREGDEAAFLRTVDPQAGPYRERQRTAFRNLDALPLAAWTLRPDGPVPADGNRATADVRLAYRLRGYDAGDATAAPRLEFVRRDGRWYVAGPAPGSPPQPWDQGSLTVVRGTHSLVLGVGHPEGRLRGIAAVADRAVPDVSAAWGASWTRRVVVLVPASQAAMGELLGAGPTAYAGVAAVTTGRNRDRTPADRVVVNPEAYDILGALGRRIVLTHETVHVATRAHTSPATPLWLSEGFADWAAFRGAARGPRQGAPELARAVAAGKLPRDLPADADFGRGAGGERVAEAYGEAWLAARMVADEWGAQRLVALYRAVGAATSREQAVGPVLRAELGVGLGEFTARWRAYLERELG